MFSLSESIRPFVPPQGALRAVERVEAGEVEALHAVHHRVRVGCAVIADDEGIVIQACVIIRGGAEIHALELIIKIP